MRSLIFSLPFIFCSLNALAVMQTVSTTSSYQTVSGNLDPGNLLGNTQVSQYQQGFNYKIEDIAENFTIVGGITDRRPDYSNYLIVQKNGTSAPLSTIVPQNDELSSLVSLMWNSGSHNLTVGYLGNINSSPFATEIYNIDYLETFFNKTTGLGVKLTQYQTDQPETYYIDLNFQSQLRPTTIHGSDYVAYWDQVLTEKWKSDLELSTGIREEDRPRNVGVVIKQSYALTDRLFTRVALTRIAELTSEPLKDERGYFTLNAAEVAFTYEPIIDFLVSASYGYVIETENNPITGQNLQVGSDQYGIAFKYRNGKFGADLSSSAKLTNISVSDISVGGGVSWQI